MVEPFFFGSNDELFAIYHPASGAPRGHGVLIAPPLLNEAMRANYALRQIALKLSASGFDVLRFDFAGTGNSALDISEISVQRWMADIENAAKELEDIAGSIAFSLVSVRFSTFLCSQLGLNRRITRHAMWDPLMSGKEWLASLRRSQDAASKRLPHAQLDRDTEFMGHRAPPHFATELDELTALPPVGDEQLRIYHEESTANRSGRQTSDYDKRLPFECNWESLSSQVLYPHAVIDNICDFLV
ncbi:MAG: hypothetical protein QNI98_03600 [Woeseiaceae bacterium]|nr:hypothetical protein [Woeseiaceae bacterium]